MEKDRGTKDDCVRLASKSHPGRFYTFNRRTGETKWLPTKQTADSKDDTQNLPINLLAKTMKTPAQDRLKRLQNCLKLRQVKPQSKHLKERKDDLGVGPLSTTSSSKSVVKSPKKALAKCEQLKCLPLQDEPATSSKDITKGSFGVDVCNEGSHSSKQLTNNKNSPKMDVENLKQTNIYSGIVKKIKEICKLPFDATKQIADEKHHSKTDSSLGVKNTSKFKTTNKAKSKQIISASVIKESIIKQINEEKRKSPERKILTGTPKNQSIPSYPRGSANERLKRLKQSLLSLQQPSSSKCCSDAPTALETNNNSASLLGRDHQLNSCDSTNTADATKEDEVEAMDWQPITKEEGHRVATVLQPTLAVEKSTKFSLKAVNDDAHQTMGDIIDAVNENLLRLSAEKQKDATDSNGKWNKDFYYFVVDTNVLLRDLTFIEDLSKMALCDTKGSLLYIPYIVLQELDRLKMRSGAYEGVKTLAVRAIKYLNTKLESNSAHVQAQSATEERHHLIDVNSADDSIINCCLQVKARIPNLLFLTEDVNLRNKAICNNIKVSTKSDLTAKRYNPSVIP